MKFAGICCARQPKVFYHTGDAGDPIRKELDGVSTTMPLPCERFEFDGEVSVDVYIPVAGTFISFSDREFEEQFLLVNGWERE